MRITRTEYAAFHLLALSVALLTMGAAAGLLLAVRAGGGAALLALRIDQAAGLASALLTMGALSGLVGGGLVAALDARPGWRAARRMRWALWGWTAAAVGLPLAWLLDLPVTGAGAAVAGAAALLVMSACPRLTTAIEVVWAAGVTVAAVGLLLPPLAAAAPVDALALAADALGHGLVTAVGLPLAVVGVVFWLARRFSTVTAAWAERGAWACGGAAALAGAWATLPSLYAVGAPEWVRAVGAAGVWIAPLAWGIIMAHVYRALARAGVTHSLASHWAALAGLLCLLGVGLVGGVQTHPDLAGWTAGTRLRDLGGWLALWGAGAAALGMVAQVGTAWGRGGRVIGYAPFWLVAGGLLLMALAAALAGVGAALLERGAGVPFAQARALLRAFMALELVGGMGVGLGMGWAALSLWIRQPVVTLAEGAEG